MRAYTRELEILIDRLVEEERTKAGTTLSTMKLRKAMEQELNRIDKILEDHSWQRNPEVMGR